MPATPTNFSDLGNELGMDFGSFAVTSKNGVQPGNTSAVGGTIYSGSGVPSAGLGTNGDFYFRTDTPATLAQRLYIRSAGSWVNALA